MVTDKGYFESGDFSLFSIKLRYKKLRGIVDAQKGVNGDESLLLKENKGSCFKAFRTRNLR